MANTSATIRPAESSAGVGRSLLEGGLIGVVLGATAMALLWPTDDFRLTAGALLVGALIGIAAIAPLTVGITLLRRRGWGMVPSALLGWAGASALFLVLSRLAGAGQGSNGEEVGSLLVAAAVFVGVLLLLAFAYSGWCSRRMRH